MVKTKNMKDIAIYGAGGFGRETACLLKYINEVKLTWNLIGFFDDGKQVGDKNEFGNILGGITELNNYATPLSVVFAIGSPHIIKKLMDKINSDKIDFPNIIAPDVKFTDKEHLNLGVGNIFCLGCTITCNVRIGNFNCFNGYITIGHDVIIKDYNAIMPGCRISGNVNIGNFNFIGVNAAILQRIKIGNSVTIGANSVIIRNTEDNTTYIGNLAKKFKF